MSYVCPDPTPEQLLLGGQLNYDAYDRCGDGCTDTEADDVLCAACLLHDELFLRGGTADDWVRVNKNFRRDCYILANAVDDVFLLVESLLRAVAYADIVDTVSWPLWHSEDRNNEITRAQGELVMMGAKIWINACCKKRGKEPVYY